MVYGFGEKKTPEPFVAACDKFVYTEILRPQPEVQKAPAPVPTEVPGAVSSSETADLGKLQPLMIAAIDANMRDDGWAALGGVGGHISKMQPAFDARNYGFKKLSELVRSLSYLEVKEVPTVRTDGTTLTNVQIKLKRVAS